MLLGLSIKFSRPWYLLLLILFFALTLIPYFTLSKKYRKTRNRITSMVLHAIVSLLVVSLLAGITFVRSTSNSANEVILVVDVSNTENQVADKRDDFVNKVINQAKFDNLKVGIVTFGFDQKYAVPLTRNYKNIFNDYLEACKDENLPDVSATNIAGALSYAKTLLTPDSNSKLVLVSDGKETDENARSVIRAIVASGTVIDTAYIDSSYEGIDDVEILNVNLPDYHVNRGEECSISIDVFCNYSILGATFRLFDNGVASNEEVYADINEGNQSVTFKHTFIEEGLHELSFEIVQNDDLIVENNKYVCYYNLQVFNKILIIEQQDGESNLLKDNMLVDNKYVVDILNVYSDEMPVSALELCSYDEIIMNNIANSDLPEGFVQILNEYVYTYGGGLFTTGGKDISNEAHAYNRTDMVGSLYQQMLPVQAINYTPPVGVIVVLDRSGSMSGTNATGDTWLELAKAGARACLSSLTERDYFGLMTLESDYDTILPLTPRTQESKILSAIESIDTANGGTVFPGAIDRAGQALRALKNVDKKHMIIVSDGQVNRNQVTLYEEYAKNYFETDGITISVVGVNMQKPANYATLEDPNYNYEDIEPNNPYNQMLRLTKIANGRLHAFSSSSETTEFIYEMREDLNAPDIKEVNFEPFYPKMLNIASSVFKDIERNVDPELNNCMTVQLDGFYGTKVRASAELLLAGDYNVPIYAQWKYGKGMVGSFMCDVSGDLSSGFMSDDNGIKLLFNIIDNLTPTEDIRSNDIKLVLYEDNYTNSLSIYTNLNEGETITGTINYSVTGESFNISLNEITESTDKGVYCLSSLNADNNYTRSKFIIKTPGAYTMEIKKLDANGNLIGSNKLYKSLAYSEEYDYLQDESIDYSEKMQSIAVLGKGKLIEDLDDPHEVIDSFDTVVYRVFDPRILFAILAIVLFLLDVAVRKFKFKWPHEIIKQRRMAKK